VGFVILLNATHSPEAMRRIQQLAVRYLKADVEAPEKPRARVDTATLRGYEGYYHDASPRNQVAAFINWLLAGRTISVSGDGLIAKQVFGPALQLVPVSDTLFRLDPEPEATIVFTRTPDGTPVMASGTNYWEKRSRWPVDLIRWTVLISAALVVTPLVMLLAWIVQSVVRRKAGRDDGPKGFWMLKAFLLLCAIGLLLPLAGIQNADSVELGTRNPWTTAMFAGSIVLPAAAVLSFLFVIDAWRTGAGRALRIYGATVSIAALILAGYLSAWGMIGFMPWSY
jgi:hypothetical protein